MEVNLTRVDEDFHFTGAGASGVEVHIDGSPEIGGHNAGARPMELLLMGLGGCSAIDIIQILKKQRQQIDSFHIKVTAERVPGEVPSLFKQIHVHFTVGGPLEEEKVGKAVNLSMDKYCSVAAILYKTATITHSFEVAAGKQKASSEGV
ncbi:putative redox protein [Pontibacter ummariensis]|uniref:Putative redox protein n=1 Tax=Pontibacter ummariensis TaxID=1610492 RepID=A0A239IQE2_9BACT|nr:OsmC family protein [Pontibacter ummariensis]PRY09703.1 putative redox protein [Pontibacter ummariensis]SNS95612.1 putative redox protein [Pontibacter ummariensis]